MKPRILLLMDLYEQFAVSSIETPESLYEFVAYRNSLKPEFIREHIKTKLNEFDAVAVFNTKRHEVERSLIEKHYKGPKILLRSGMDYDPEGIYTMKVTLATTHSEFDKLVEETFRDL